MRRANQEGSESGEKANQEGRESVRGGVGVRAKE